MGYFYILLTILFTVYGQLIIKWQVNLAGSMSSGATSKIAYLGNLLINPWVISGLFAYGLAAIAWMATMTKFNLSYAYPFMSLAFVLVIFLSVFIFNEPMTVYNLLGTVLIVSGIVVLCYGG